MTDLHLSWSTVEAMSSCGKKYELRKVIGVEERPSFAAIGGSAVHAASEDVERLLYPELFLHENDFTYEHEEPTRG